MILRGLYYNVCSREKCRNKLSNNKKNSVKYSMKSAKVEQKIKKYGNKIDEIQNSGDIKVSRNDGPRSVDEINKEMEVRKYKLKQIKLQKKQYKIHEKENKTTSINHMLQTAISKKEPEVKSTGSFEAESQMG